MSAFISPVALLFSLQSLPIIPLFGCVMSILCYLGLVQWIVQKVSWFLQITTGTTATDPLVVAGSIFVGLLPGPVAGGLRSNIPSRQYLGEGAEEKVLVGSPAAPRLSWCASSHAVAWEFSPLVLPPTETKCVVFTMGVNALTVDAASLLSAFAVNSQKLSYKGKERKDFNQRMQKQTNLQGIGAEKLRELTQDCLYSLCEK
ncbi:hypothetical protein PANDA_017798 [Ailuropoda melanoleuca]|uniref:Uncharacterized protein n=1 Tax=Ailuropoda melanoleuca TaxID=9646 RepID=D2HYJ7_AILME|nr:hypothetical protein PANDA_017798 [Ailuropoda melanoleuca]